MLVVEYEGSCLKQSLCNSLDCFVGQEPNLAKTYSEICSTYYERGFLKRTSRFRSCLIKKPPMLCNIGGFLNRTSKIVLLELNYSTINFLVVFPCSVMMLTR